MHMNEIPAQDTHSAINSVFVLQGKASPLPAHHCQQIKLDGEVSELVLSRVFCLPAFCTVTHTERHMCSKATYR